jgi:hypothetical protein
MMPTNKLRSRAASLLMQALKLHEAGRNAEAHKLTMQAANCLEDAVSIEGFRLGLNRKSSSTPKAPKPTQRKIAKAKPQRQPKRRPQAGQYDD